MTVQWIKVCILLKEKWDSITSFGALFEKVHTYKKSQNLKMTETNSKEIGNETQQAMKDQKTRS